MTVLKWIEEKIHKQQINVSLLIFLLLFLNVKLWVKVVALILICTFNRKSFTVPGLKKKQTAAFLCIHDTYRHSKYIVTV